VKGSCRKLGRYCLEFVRSARRALEEGQEVQLRRFDPVAIRLHTRPYFFFSYRAPHRCPQIAALFLLALTELLPARRKGGERIEPRVPPLATVY
jgi:hypothetical protein